MSTEVRLHEVCTLEKTSLNPQTCPNELFAHYSIPAFDDGQQPTIESGAAIKSQKICIERGVVLISKLNPRIPRVWFVNDNYENTRICSTEFVPFRPNLSRLLPEYLAYALRHLLTTGQITGTTSAATKSRERARLADIAELKITLPSIDEQRRLVNILSRAEGIVRLRREAQKKATELIPALFLDMFGDPATNPRGWRTIKLGEVLVEPPTLGTMAKPSSNSGHWLDLRVANIQDGLLTLEDKKVIDLPDHQINRFSLRDKDIVLARAIGSLDHLGKVVVVYPGANKWTFDSHLMRIRLDKSHLIPEVLKSFLESSGGRKEFLKHTRRSAVQFNINGKELRAISVPLPPISLQQTFLEQTRIIDSIQSQQTTATQKAQATFDALLAQTFGGL